MEKVCGDRSTRANWFQYDPSLIINDEESKPQDHATSANVKGTRVYTASPFYADITRLPLS